MSEKCALVSDPVIFRAQPDGPERVVRPCSRKHREYWLAGYIVLSCRKCTSTIETVPVSEIPDNTCENDYHSRMEGQ